MGHVTVNWNAFSFYSKPHSERPAPSPVEVTVLTKLEPRSLIRYQKRDVWVENTKLVHTGFRKALYYAA